MRKIHPEDAVSIPQLCDRVASSRTGFERQTRRAQSLRNECCGGFALRGKREESCPTNGIEVRMRLFVGIAVPREIADRLSVVVRRLVLAQQLVEERIRFAYPEDMHITLSFLGEIAEERVAGIGEALEGVRAAAMQVRITGLGAFRNAGVVYASVERTAALNELAEEVMAAMERCGVRRELREYRPHITLARLRLHRRLALLDNWAVREVFRAEAMNLYESVVGGQGPRYRVLRTFVLG